MAIVERKLSNFKGVTVKRGHEISTPFAYTRFLSNQLKTQQERDTRWKRMQSWIRSMKIRFVFEENNYTGWRANYYSISRYWSIIELVWIVYFVRRYFPEVVDNRYIISISYRFKIIIQNYNSKFKTTHINQIVVYYMYDMLRKHYNLPACVGHVK